MTITKMRIFQSRLVPCLYADGPDVSSLADEKGNIYIIFILYFINYKTYYIICFTL